MSLFSIACLGCEYKTTEISYPSVTVVFINQEAYLIYKFIGTPSWLISDQEPRQKLPNTMSIVVERLSF
jgi:hypothetical protein